ncbi:DEAD/DEAH box helicase [Thalassoglobus polymorphus]|uniref:ATP-dependent helicase HepA n=1 Tax=Thalassoglobus polymorphus TaxID=2527994 RepID=A0A517QIU2_9PLAN|nr:DEAD/DEAH box helicase [Thalassoglobus polymorphus]QDT31505.1 ATP-dependent helicase HepA [Thalassoglobus polymorphus]
MPKRKKHQRNSELPSAPLPLLMSQHPGLGKLLLEDEEFQDLLTDSNSNSNPGTLPTNGLEWIDAWNEVLDVFIREHHYADRLRSKRLKHKIEIQELVPTGEVRATDFVNKKKRQLKLSFNPLRLAYDCTCTCPSKGFCEHTYALVEHLKKELFDSDSKIFLQILGPDYSDLLRKQKRKELLQLINRVSQDSPSHLTISSEEDLSQPEERVRWNLKTAVEYGMHTMELHPVIQKETKRGGWSKGREIKLSTFLSTSPQNWSTVDRAIVDSIEQDEYEFYDPQVDFPSVFRALAGTDVFLVNRQPSELRIQELELIVIEDDNNYRLSTNVLEQRSQLKNPESFYSFSGGFMILDQKSQSATFIPASEAAIDLSNTIEVDNVSFRKDEKELFFEQLKILQQAFSVRLPEGMIDEERAIELELTLLLQMQKSGQLGVTICFTKPDGSLIYPGDGLGRETIQEDGKTIQLIRNLDTERQQALELERELGLSHFEKPADSRFRIEDQDAIFKLLTDIGDLVGQEKIKVVWHRASVKRFDILGHLTASNVRVQVKKNRDWFGLQGSCRIGNEEIALKDLLAGLRGESLNGLIEIQPGKWAAITEELKKSLQRLADVSLESRGSLRLDQSAAMAVAALEDAQIQMEADKAWNKNLARLRNASELSFDPPAALNCDLRDYQVEGFRWMARLSEWGMGGILADDMGLGKTVQTLAMLLQRVETGPALVIAPTSLGFNWQAECERFAPSLNPIQFRESNREELINSASEGDVIICSYGLALREAELLKTQKWGSLVLDEAQNIKNGNSKTSREIRKLKADWKIALTGTPIENHLGELWSILQAVAPGVLGGWEQFRKRFAAPIEKNQDEERRHALARVISPFVLRRTKKAVLKDLPDRDESNLFVELSDVERKRYDQMRLAAVSELDELSTVEFSQDQRFRVLQILTRLRQLSCHIGLLDETWTGSSAKLDLLMEKLEELKENGHRPLIFSQFTSHLGLIRQACDEKGFSYQYLDGQTTPRTRKNRVEKFQNGEGDAFLISLKAGGTGLNLTAADYVIHMDPWWNPAVEDQATDRAHRIGQTRNVMVYRIIAQGTIEEQILKLHEEKRDLVEGILAGAEAAGKLSTQQLAGLIRGETADMSIAKTE